MVAPHRAHAPAAPPDGVVTAAGEGSRGWLWLPLTVLHAPRCVEERGADRRHPPPSLPDCIVDGRGAEDVTLTDRADCPDETTGLWDDSPLLR